MATVALQILDVLREYGVDTVFGIPGGAVAPLYGAMVQRPELRVVTAKHETGAAFLAIGYALATGKPGVVITTAGPGITNALTGVASAFYDGVPLIYIAGEVPRSLFGRSALQEGSASEFDAVGLVRRFTKFAAQLSRPDAAVPVLRRAIATALSGRRGPAFLSLPLDVAAAEGESAPTAGTAQTSFGIDPAQAAHALELLATARRPLILAGAGARELGSRAALLRLAERVGAPVAVTPKGKGSFPEDHGLYLGVFGFGGHESVVRYLEGGVDVVLVAGSGLNDFSTNAWSPLLRAEKAFLQIDVDAGQFGKNYRIDLGLLGRMEVVIDRMLASARPDLRPPVRAPVAVERQPVEASPRGMITTGEVVRTLNEVCPVNSVFTADMGEHLAFALHYLEVRAGGEFLTSLGFGSMGSGVCVPIGYQMGAPHRRTYAIVGDGGTLMYGNELVTAVQHKVGTTFVVINDSRLNMCHHGLHTLFGAAPDLSTPLVDFATVARSMGAHGEVIHTREELARALRTPVDGPRVLDVRVDPEIRLGGSQRLTALRQFTERDAH